MDKNNNQDKNWVHKSVFVELLSFYDTRLVNVPKHEHRAPLNPSSLRSDCVDTVRVHADRIFWFPLVRLSMIIISISVRCTVIGTFSTKP